MKKRRIQLIKFLSTIIAILIIFVCYGSNWLLTCGIIKLITICFSINFSWMVATGIWLVLVLISLFFKRNSN